MGTRIQKGLVLQIVTWGVLVHWYKNTDGLVVWFVTRIRSQAWSILIQKNRVRFVTCTNPDWSIIDDVTRHVTVRNSGSNDTCT